MPPKSAKKEKPTWWKCEQCKRHVLTAELGQHQEDQCQDVDKLSGYLTAEVELICNSVECLKLSTFEDLKDVGEAQLDGLILMGRGAVTKLGLVLGDYVEVSLVCPKFSFIRKVWPMDDKFGARVIVNHIDEVQGQDKKSVSIKPFKSTISIAHELELNLQGGAESLAWIDKNKLWLAQLVRKQFIGRVLNERSLLTLRLCNKVLQFDAVNISLKDSPKGTIEQSLQNLTLGGSKYYQISRDSTVTIATTGSSQETQSVSFCLDRIGGLETVIGELKEITKLALGISKPTSTTHSNVPISRGVLVYGVSGTGKTLLVNSLAAHFKCKTVRINCSEVFSKFYGESEGNVSKLFNKALQNYPSPTIIIVEEMHNICPKAEASDIVKRLSNFFVNLLDNLNSSVRGSRTVLIGTTDNPDSLNPAVRRSGRLDYEFEIPIPDADAREQILLKSLTLQKHALYPDEIKSIAKVTHGYVGADLVSLVGRASHEAKSTITYASMASALQHVKASAMREIMIESPNVHWADIGGQEDLKLKLRQIIEWPIHRPEIFTRLGISPPRGLLMFGPPGCSKTMIAKAIATESKVNFLSIKGSELFSMWVGESERAVRELFRKARQVAPSIIFFDEIDAIGGERSAESGSSVKERVLAQILTEIDGVSALKNVKIIAATNRPDLIDKALMRPGRLDRIIYVRLPDFATRKEIFRIKLSKIPVSADVQRDDLVARTEGYSGSEIEAICQEAALKALEESFDTLEIPQKFFDHALNVVKPRTSEDLLMLYENYLKQEEQ
uniref:Spermatogenesis-associated protein 5 n=1 Tax=Culex pipiens TaxID=7175 RepID=A0A8D8NVT5_CULPI